MEAVTLFKKKYHIDLRDVDFKKDLKLSVLFSYFQDIASEAAANLGAGIDLLEKEHNALWILMRIRVDIARLPKWDEDITIETWPLEPKRLEFDRDYLVRDRNGEVIVRAISAWVVMDKKERKLKRASSISLNYPSPIEERAIDSKLGKLKNTGIMETAYKRVIGYSDVDFNGYLNNSKYVDFIMDCFPIEAHKRMGAKTIEVNFINEALPGDVIILNIDTSATGSNKLYIEGVNEESQKTVFRAQVKIGEIH
ncbi:acyl-[acyl-carrier-protein] thioesterase [Oceanobacillus bengalensis]|uniref:Acyl-ACP thioesterase n=1 Tax=Oceanobacillus bengalensis TaxID=1435466 RepID=A0A494Z6I1_9BACI|nr:acyl-ACP thioesterase domain-containing protein [Oceanobacillus bengalensis]RKQ18163.1 acyl-ACP thioesterase [Oceanobacillus bengalensis]